MSVTVQNPFPDGMLPAIWDYVHPVTGEKVFNVEALCRKHLNALSAGVSPPLERSEYEDGLGFLFAQVIVLAEQKFDPAKATSSLGDFLSWRLPRALIDHWRHEWRRNGEGRINMRRVEQAARDHGLDDPDPRVRGPLEAPDQRAGDAQGDRAFPREWSDVEGDRRAERPAEGLGLSTRRGGPLGADRGGPGTSGRDGRPVALAPRGAPAFVDCGSCGVRLYAQAPNGIDRWHYPEACYGCGGPL